MRIPEPVIFVDDLQVSYPGQGRGKKRTSNPILQGITFKVFPGDRVAIMGESGCGKSTLLRAIGGLHPSSKGVVTCGIGEGRSTGHDCMMVFQDFNQLYPFMTAVNNIAFAIVSSKYMSLFLTPRPIKNEAIERARFFLDLVGLSDKSDAYPAHLSGGQKQRVAIACALALEPKLLLMDEPFSAIDPSLKAKIRSEVTDIFDRLETTVLFVTHSREEAELMSNRILILEGRPATVTNSVAAKYLNPKTQVVGSPELQHV